MLRVNENVMAALKAAVSDAGQPKEVAQQLVSWLDALATGNAVLTDDAEAAKRISDLLGIVRMPSDEAEEDDVEADV